MRVTRTGQVTIPIDIREQLGIGPETEVEFEVVGGVVHLRKVDTRRGRGQRVLDRLWRRRTRDRRPTSSWR